MLKEFKGLGYICLWFLFGFFFIIAFLADESVVTKVIGALHLGKYSCGQNMLFCLLKKLYFINELFNFHTLQ